MQKILRHYFIPHEGNNYRPHFFGRKSVALISLFSIVVFGLSLVYPMLASKINFLADVLPAVLIDEANENRALYNITPLTRNSTLERAASEKANDMAFYSYFAHISPTGITPWYWFTKAGYHFVYAGENLAINFNDSEAVTRAWMDSPGHRANILNGNFTEIGIATANGYYEGHPTIFVVQLFGKPITASTLATSPAPAVASAEVESSPIVEPEVTIVSEIDRFVAVKNTQVTDESLATNLGSEGKVGTPVTKYGTTPAKILSSPGSLLDIIYFIIAIIIAIAMFISLTIELKRHHGKHLITGLFLILLLGVLIYAYGNYSGTSILIV